MKLPPIAYIYTISDVLPVCAAIPKSHRPGKAASLAAIFVIGDFLEEMLSLVLAFRRTNNLWVQHTYDLFEYAILAMIFSLWLRNRTAQVWLRSSIIGYVLVWIIAKVTVEPLMATTQYVHSLSAVVISIISLITLIQIAREDQPHLHDDMRFWFSLGILTYFAGNTFLFIYFRDFAQLSYQAALSVWTLHWIIGIATNILLMISFIWNRPR